MDDYSRALRQLTGNPSAEFHPGQREAIEALVERRQTVLVVQRTGWGKSAVYFVATRLLRERGLGTTLIVSPLLVLMDNQIDAARRLGLRAVSINSANTMTVDELVPMLEADEIDVLLISPERFANKEFADSVMPLVGRRPGLIVIDEIHCISDWGHDFRPDYRRIGQLISGLPNTVPVLGCTATANDRVVDDVALQLGTDVPTLRGPLRRETLALSVLDLPERAARLAWLDRNLPSLDGTGIIYCLTIRDAEIVASYLRSKGHAVTAYHGDMLDEHRREAMDRFLANDVKAIVATSALGMGYDKPDVAFVVHYQSPGSVVAYYQQVGRAGRGIARSVGILMRGAEDTDIQNFFITSSFPKREEVDAILDVLDASDEPVSVQKLQKRVNLSLGRIESTLKQLDVEGIVRRESAKTYSRTAKPWVYPAERIEKIDQQRRREQHEMVDYFTTDQCRMRFIVNCLDDPDRSPCGSCDNCVGSKPGSSPSESEVQEALAFTRRGHLSVEARKQWADRTNIPPARRMQDGKCLSVWDDGGYGSQVKRGKQRNAGFDDELVDAVVALVTEWNPAPFPTWVTCVPSQMAPQLVPDFARRVADRLGLPFHMVVDKIRSTEPQKNMRNSAFQAANVAGAFRCASSIPDGPVLLIDDLVDSRWTLTEVASVLRAAGSGSVFPVVLASTAPRGS